MVLEVRVVVTLRGMVSGQERGSFWVAANALFLGLGASYMDVVKYSYIKIHQVVH